MTTYRRDTPPPLFAPPVDPNLPETDVARITGQNAQVLALLRAGPLTSTQAIERGITRLAARIHDLRAQGVAIERRMVGAVAEYRLAGGGVSSGENA